MMELPVITVEKFVKELDTALIISFKAFDRESQERLYYKWLAANDKAHFAEAVLYRGEILFRIENYSIDIAEQEVSFSFPAGKIYVELTEELLEALKMVKEANVYVNAKIGEIYKTKRGKTKIYADELTVKVADMDIKAAKELLKEYEPLDLICYAFGYIPAPEIKALIIPRVLPVFKPDGRGVHVIQFTPPETGKTTTIRLLSEFINGYHVLSFPSRAKLIGDARFNSYGLCYKYDALFIEEFDKISGKRADEFREDYEALLTGLEQGVWQREKSSKSDIHYINPVSFYLAGNVNNHELNEYGLANWQKDAREKVKDVIEQLTGVNAEPFLSRFVYVEWISDYVPAMQFINYNEENKPQYLPPAISRGLFRILTADVKRDKHRRETNRLVRHFNVLKNVLETLNVQIDDETIENLVIGATNFLTVFRGDKEVSEPSERPDEVKEIEIDVSRE